MPNLPTPSRFDNDRISRMGLEPKRTPKPAIFARTNTKNDYNSRSAGVRICDGGR